MPASSNIPEGKKQVSVLVATDIHDAVKRIATNWNKRYSYVYEQGIEALAETGKGDSRLAPDKVSLAQELTQGVNPRDWDLLRAFSKFLRQNRDEHNMGIVKFILEKYMPGNS